MYRYAEIKKQIFTEEGSIALLQLRDTACSMLKSAGAFKMGRVIGSTKCSGDTWLFMACIDRMVEMGEIVELTEDNVAGQDRVFTRK